MRIKTMANTFTQIYIHFVFSVMQRECIIQSNWENELYKYMTGIVTENKHKLIAINGMPDHVHMLIGLKPIQSISDLMQDVKGSSSKWINDRKFVRGKFNWQSGYGGFSYSHSQLDNIVQYIINQKEHHKKETFKEEYLKILKSFDIKYDKKYIFDFIEY